MIPRIISSQIKLVLMGLLLVGVAALILPLFVSPHTHSKIADCGRAIVDIRIRLQLAQKDFPDEKLAITKPGELNSAVAVRIRRAAAKEGIAMPAYLSGDTLVDPWGTPFNMILQADGTVLVWSSGPNRINDDRAGDDVVALSGAGPTKVPDQ